MPILDLTIATPARDRALGYDESRPRCAKHASAPRSASAPRFSIERRWRTKRASKSVKRNLLELATLSVLDSWRRGKRSYFGFQEDRCFTGKDASTLTVKVDAPIASLPIDNGPIEPHESLRDQVRCALRCESLRDQSESHDGAGQRSQTRERKT
jgi:hypothetical protein